MHTWAITQVRPPVWQTSLFYDMRSYLSSPANSLTSQFRGIPTVLYSNKYWQHQSDHCLPLSNQFRFSNSHFWNVTLIPCRLKTFLTWSKRKDRQQWQVFQTWHGRLTTTEGDLEHTLFFHTRLACGNLIRSNTHTPMKPLLENELTGHCDSFLCPLWPLPPPHLGCPMLRQLLICFLPLFVHIAQGAGSKNIPL